MKNFKRVLATSVLAVMLASVAAGQKPFSVVKVPNSGADTATAINNAGEVVVNWGTSSTSSVSLWNLEGTVESLSVTGSNELGVAINGNNDVAGTGQPSGSNEMQAFLWRADSGTQWLGTLGGVLSAANGLNAARDVVGMSYTAAGQQHAFLWTAGGGMQDLTPNLASLGGATAMGINSSGQVVGYYYPNGASNVVGFTWTEAGGLQSFGTPGTLALAVNDSGTVVGRFDTAAGFRHAFSYTATGGMQDLGTLGGSMSTALGINNKGWIVGTSLTSDQSGELRGFLWTPTGGMQNFATISGLGSPEVYTVQVNDYGDIALTTGLRTVLLVPNMVPTGTSSVNPSVVGQPVTITANVSSIAGPPPDGETIQFLIGKLVVGTATLKNGIAQCTINGVAQCNISGLAAGPHTISVSYGGDVYYPPFSRPVIKQVVNP